jgi:hypothetical protein
MPKEELLLKISILAFPPKCGQGNKLVATLTKLGRTFK